MSKLEEYRKWCAKHYRESVGFDLADPAIAELEAENERLKCCGNCGHCDAWDEDTECLAGKWTHTTPGGHSYEMSSVAMYDHCHFTPSRWAERSAP